MASVQLEVLQRNPWYPNRPIYPYSGSFYPKYLEGWPDPFSVEFAQEYAEDFADFPDLVEALQQFDKGNYQLLRKRHEMAPGAHISLSLLKSMRELARARGEEIMVVPHPPAITAHEHLAVVQREAEVRGFPKPTVLKTVTMKFHKSGIVLFSGVGDFEVSEPMKGAIAAVFGWKNKYVTINPDSFDPRKIGWIRGQVKPFVYGDDIYALDGLCYLPKAPDDPSTHIAITTSLWDSAILPIEEMEALRTNHLAGLPLTPVSCGIEGLGMYIVNKPAA